MKANAQRHRALELRPIKLRANARLLFIIRGGGSSIVIYTFFFCKFPDESVRDFISGRTFLSLIPVGSNLRIAENHSALIIEV